MKEGRIEKKFVYQEGDDSYKFFLINGMFKKLYPDRRIKKIQWAYGMSDVKSRKKKHSSEILIFSDAIRI